MSRRAALLAVLLVACHDGPTTPPSAETTLYGENAHFTSEYTGWISCANRGLGENVAVQIDGHVLFRAVSINDGEHVLVRDFVRTQGTAVGQTSGEVYRLISTYQETTHRDEPEGFVRTIPYTTLLIGGEGLELLISGIIHATRNANGELVVYFETERFDCM